MENYKIPFLSELKDMYQIVTDRTRALDEASFTWLEEVLDEAKKSFGQSDACLLPKTPSAKRKGRGRKKKSTQNSTSRKLLVEEEQDDYVAPEQKPTRQTRKRVPTVALSDDEDFEDVIPNKIMGMEEIENEPTPPVRRTRANKKTASTTSRAKNTKNKVKNKKAKSEEPIKNIIDDNVDVAEKEDHDESVVIVSVTEEWTQSASLNINSKYCITGSTNIVRTPKNKIVHEAAKTRIQNFGLMNVKEKVQAYEDIVLISPPTPCEQKQNSFQENNTPKNVSESLSTPKTLVSCTTMSVLSPKTPENQILIEPSPVLEVDKKGSGRKGTPRLSGHSRSSRKSHRTSLRVSLKALPSSEKALHLHSEVGNKPARTRTRLRLKKKDKKQEDTENENEENGSTMTTSEDDKMDTDSQESLIMDIADGKVEDVVQGGASKATRTKTRKRQSSGKEKHQVEQPEVRSSTRTKTRLVAVTKSENSCTDSDSALSSSERTEEEVIEEFIVIPTVVTVVKSTRTKTRAAQASSVSSKSDTKDGNKDSGMGCGGSTSSVDGEESQRTRTKQRKSVRKSCEEEVFSSPTEPAPRVTRTKTRKRQHEEEADEVLRQPKRSCTGSITIEDESKTPTNNSATDDDSSDGEVLSPKCPQGKVVRPHPQSFLNNLKSTSTNAVRPANLNTGLVRSFITRNSPAPKPTLKEIQEKKKKELLEKDKKDKERLKKREEEYKKKMEEMRKKREDKMKKVQEMRELKKQQDKENRIQLEKRLAEKRQLTNKLKEEREKQEREKQKLRNQKFEEAEERRKQEEEERQKKLQEQLENEKFHNNMMQRKKEFEEQERQRKIEEEKQRGLERQQEIEKERERERNKLRLAEEERAREWQKKKEERERLIVQEKAEKDRHDMEKKKERELQLKKEMDRIKEQERVRVAEQERIRDQQRRQDEELKKMVDKHNQLVQTGQTKPALPKPNLNKTHSLTEPTVQSKNDSYEMTPTRVPLPASAENYNIEDLNSSDETDDEEAPRKAIPDWAQGSQLKTLLIKQHFNPPDLDSLFDIIDPPDLNVLFVKKKARFNKRTSSAHWDTPVLRPGTLGRV